MKEAKAKERKDKPVATEGDATSEGARNILHAAERLFATQGFDAVSIQAIAEAAGVCKANIFHHFGSKEGLYLAVLRLTCQRAAPLLQTLVRKEEGFPERLDHFATDHLAYLLAHPGTMRLLLRELLESDAPRGQQLAEQVVGDNFTRLIGILREGQRRGELRAEADPAIAAALLVGANVFLFQARSVLRHLEGVEFADAPERYSKGLVDILLHGLLVPAEDGTH
ncbi:MAG: TetR/AcrR family transcriptional regulator [Gammaproteobacteria bacterium]